MPRRSTIFAPGEYYHIINRGSLRHVLFHDAEMYRIFISLLVHFADNCNVTIVAMSLMPNHFHILVRIDEGGDLSLFMQKVCWKFSNVVNRLLRRTGTIFQGRFLSKHVCSENYLRAVCRYIHLNPVTAGLARNPEDYEYSTYAETIGLRSRLKCDPKPILELFRGVSGYREFVEGGMNDPKVGDNELLRDLAEMKLI